MTKNDDDLMNKMVAFWASFISFFAIGLVVIWAAVCCGVLSLEFFTVTLVFILSILLLMTRWSKIQDI
jgi:hypothetical protein